MSATANAERPAATSPTSPTSRQQPSSFPQGEVGTQYSPQSNGNLVKNRIERDGNPTTRAAITTIEALGTTRVSLRQVAAVKPAVQALEFVESMAKACRKLLKDIPGMDQLHPSNA
eukprot:jgi/Chlat1/5242/Chrsp33S05008